MPTVNPMFKPSMDLSERDQMVTARFHFPGVSEEDIQIDLHDGKLVVSAEAKESEEYDQYGSLVRFGKYSRYLQISPGIKEDEVTASMSGITVTVIFPKSPTPEPAKRITISSNDFGL